MRRSRVPGESGEESLYLRYLSEKQVPVTVKLRDGERVEGWIEYFDERMIRLTREPAGPNLFIYKEQIHTIIEPGRRDQARRKLAERTTQPTPEKAPLREGLSHAPDPV